MEQILSYCIYTCISCYVHRVKRALPVCEDSLALKDLQDQRDLQVQKDTEEQVVLLAYLEIVVSASLLLVLQILGTRVKKESK